MNTTFLLRPLCLFLAVGAMAVASVEWTVACAAEAGTAVVTGLRGLAQHASAGGAYAAVQVGTVVRAGDTLQTATGSALDLDYGGAVGTVRLLQSTTVTVTSSGATGLTLELKGGEVLGHVKPLPAGAKFQVDVPAGIAGVIEGEFRLNARGYLVVLGGNALFAEVRPDADPMVHSLKGSEPKYFSPVEHAVRPAPAPLVDEVRKQLKARLPKK